MKTDKRHSPFTDSPFPHKIFQAAYPVTKASHLFSKIEISPIKVL